MRIFPTLILAAGIGLGGFGLAAPAASAMPMNGLAPAVAMSEDIAQSVENVRWICGPYGGCRWVPGWRYWGPRPWRPYGCYGGWRRHGYGWGGYYHRHYW
ncbi:hypothetical protein [Methylocapsa aurea]|uniref:hypothetical protein n=1 Tax=Methylocapsa aurea TaxID=663610 RepID=UPI0012EB2A04|nr:hypothetical protein [Methylocapsa aurea]